MQLYEWVSIQLATLIKQQEIRAAPYILTIQNEDPSGTPIAHRCTASVGVAMYEAKRTGKNSIQFWASEAGS